jgi:hypothetical protein
VKRKVVDEDHHPASPERDRRSGEENATGMVGVRIIARKGETVLVEWVAGEDLRRSVVPAGIVTVDETGQAWCEAPEQGIAYGWPWEQLIVLQATPEQMARELRKRGIWTVADLKANAMAAVAAFQTVYGWDVSRLLVELEKTQEK